jgi:hypothetical protein
VGAALALTSPDIASEHKPEHAAERARMLEALAEYREREARIKAEGRKKPDMISYAETKGNYDIATRQRWGHVPGTVVGESLIGRCEVAITAGPYTPALFRAERYAASPRYSTHPILQASKVSTPLNIYWIYGQVEITY